VEEHPQYDNSLGETAEKQIPRSARDSSFAAGDIKGEREDELDD
jgi:hypothetical protein